MEAEGGGNTWFVGVWDVETEGLFVVGVVAAAVGMLVRV
jgi:hypothetical protein